MEKYITKYLPIVLVSIALIFQYNLFVTPEKLEVKHREILNDISKTYTTKEQYNDLKGQLNIMQAKIDKIYDVLMDGGKRNGINKY
ncbi:MAG: hypothetical protein MJ237_07495 [bacterium]|nr:hypothetical protein [bacterium]